MNLPYKNIIHRPVRSAILICLAAALSCSVFAGSLLVGALRNGFASLQARLGADIMVVPYEAATKSSLENILLQGNTGYFYMDGSRYDEVAELDGIGKITAQYYLASASASCCSIPVQIIGFDPATDFVITPWIKKSNGNMPGYLDVVVGNDLNAFVGDELTFYGTTVRVAAKLDKTGTNYDTAVFANRDTVETLIRSSQDKKLNEYGNRDAGNAVSCVLVDVAKDREVEEVLNDINVHVKRVKAVRTKNMISGIARSLAGVSEVAKAWMIATWVLVIGILAAAFALITNERREEFAVLRMVGASRKKLFGLVLAEGALLGLAGSLVGVAAGALCVLPFSGFIEQKLGLPFLLPNGIGILGAGVAAVLLTGLSAAITSAVAAYRVTKTDRIVV
ncbi:MAG: ABC transporter permease [Lachnospiraceae bacterium]|nr:ABC transporter permease [Lachnospiraceae bacterium]